MHLCCDIPPYMLISLIEDLLHLGFGSLNFEAPVACGIRYLIYERKPLKKDRYCFGLLAYGVAISKMFIGFLGNKLTSIGVSLISSYIYHSSAIALSVISM